MFADTVFLCSALLISLAVFVFQLADAKAEYSARSFIINYRNSEWWIHNDEKTILPEALSIWLGGKIGTRVSDVGPWPISAAFGPLSTILNLAGFCVLGFNAGGFRLFYITASFAANILFILSFFAALPVFTAFALSLFITLNYRSFLAGRHAYPENLLSLLLALCLFLLTVCPVFLSGHIREAAFLAGAAVMIKPNYPFYLIMLLFGVSLSGGAGFRESAWPLVFFAAGTVFFELLQLLVLRCLGTAGLRVENILLVLRQHRGSGVRKALVRSFPDGARVFVKHLDFIMDWFETPPVLRPLVRPALALLALAPLPLFFFDRGAPPVIFALFAAHVFFLGLSSMMFFYLKRACPWFPVTVLALAVSAAELTRLAGRGAEAALDAALVFFLTIFISRQISRLRSLSQIRVPSLKTAPAEIEPLLPEKAVVYAQCFPFRYFWQSEKIRFKSCDDQILDNEKIIEWALREGGEYLLLGSRDTGLDALKYKNVRHQVIKTFHPSPVVTDYPESYMLCKIIRN
jgi:hypothetical protein